MKNTNKLNTQELKKINGGKYYGNGRSCNKHGCKVVWGKAIGIIGNNAAVNLHSGGNAGWNGN
ncbi:leucocin A/sakacin P family class II bacteriocin [Lacticaseibacillus porcinae]|uniref:leucocin A/sakacin P family class II bacteriocin n=1 Tax=Lacticaseibacillus porcinae TaxID=1123687 RepID=UPI000F78F25F|nr:leucocin A/sakacin P family class II bacteriocin [Lacticaseibacillus porcinae]